MANTRKLRIWGGIGLGLVGAVVAAIFLVDWKGFVERRASAALGRPVTIGHLSLDIGMRPTVVVSNMHVGNMAEGAKVDMVDSGNTAVRIDLWELIGGKVVLPELAVQDTKIYLERIADGSVNWKLGSPDAAPQSGSSSLPQIDNLIIKDTSLVYKDVKADADVTLQIATEPAKDGGEARVHITGKGTYRKAPVRVEMTGGSLLALRDMTKPYPIDVHVVAGATEITFKGTVTDPTKMVGLDVLFTIKGKDMADLYPLTGLALPPTPPYSLRSQVDRDGPKWVLTNVQGKLGKSDMEGKLALDPSGKVPRMEGDLRSKLVDLDDLAGFIGATPGEQKTPEAQKAAAAEREKSRKARTEGAQKEVASTFVIPDRTINLEKLNSMNADIRFHGQRIAAPDFPLDNMSVKLGLHDGVLTLKPLEFGIEKGQIGIDLTLNTHVKPVKTDAIVTVSRYPIHRLVGKVSGTLEKTVNNLGVIGGRLEVHGNGDSMHRILADASGNVGLISSGGQISLILVELMGLDVAEALGLAATEDKPVPIRCMVADFGMQKGVMTARHLVLDTTDTVVWGGGEIDLGRETIRLRLEPKPKDWSPLSLRAPLNITGTFAHPSFMPDVETLALKGGAAVALSVVLTPVAGLLALIDVGGGEDANCGALIHDAKAPPAAKK